MSQQFVQRDNNTESYARSSSYADLENAYSPSVPMMEFEQRLASHNPLHNPLHMQHDHGHGPVNDKIQQMIQTSRQRQLASLEHAASPTGISTRYQTHLPLDYELDGYANKVHEALYHPANGSPLLEPYDNVSTASTNGLSLWKLFWLVLLIILLIWLAYWLFNGPSNGDGTGKNCVTKRICSEKIPTTEIIKISSVCPSSSLGRDLGIRY